MSTKQISVSESAKLSKLPPAQRHAYESVEIHGLTPAEAARGTDRSSGTVRTHLYRARKKLGEGA